MFRPLSAAPSMREFKNTIKSFCQALGHVQNLSCSRAKIVATNLEASTRYFAHSLHPLDISRSASIPGVRWMDDVLIFLQLPKNPASTASKPAPTVVQFVCNTYPTNTHTCKLLDKLLEHNFRKSSKIKR